jgi:competence protein ComEA
MEPQPTPSQPTRPIFIISAGILIGLLLAALLLLLNSRPAGKPVLLLPSATPANIVIDVSGAVVNPGLYEMPPGSRVAEAIQAAGGCTADAQIASINQAGYLLDGQQVFVPGSGQTSLPLSTIGTTTVININTAGVPELATLPGIGESRAADIISYRQNNGAFDTIEDIMNVPGIGPGIFGQIQDSITTGH